MNKPGIPLDRTLNYRKHLTKTADIVESRSNPLKNLAVYTWLVYWGTNYYKANTLCCSVLALG